MLHSAIDSNAYEIFNKSVVPSGNVKFNIGEQVIETEVYSDLVRSDSDDLRSDLQSMSDHPNDVPLTR